MLFARPQTLQLSTEPTLPWAARQPSGSGAIAPTPHRPPRPPDAISTPQDAEPQGPHLISKWLQDIAAKSIGFEWQPLSQAGKRPRGDTQKSLQENMRQEHPLGKLARGVVGEARAQEPCMRTSSQQGLMPPPAQQPAVTHLQSISECNGSTGSPRASAGNAQWPPLDPAQRREANQAPGGTALRTGLLKPLRHAESPVQTPRHGSHLPMPDVAGSPQPHLRPEGQQVSDCPATSLVTDMMSVNHNHAVGTGDHHDACTSRPGRVQAGLFGVDNQFDDVDDINSIFSFL